MAGRRHIKYTKQQLVHIADIRAAGKGNFQSCRPLSPDYEIIGVFGEAAFACKFDVPMDTTRRIDGDDGYDFLICTLRIDVKTAAKPYNLIIEKGKTDGADIFVLAGYNGNGARLIGWEWNFIMVECPVKDFGYGISNHYKPSDNLRSMTSLYTGLHHLGMTQHG